MIGDSEIIGDLVSQSQAASHLVPDLSEKYRCMVVWDTRDVGWLMVRKNGSNGLKPEEMEGNMEKCQWRSCNIDKLNQNSSGDDGNSSRGGGGGNQKSMALQIL